jgi:hypothetical protein
MQFSIQHGVNLDMGAIDCHLTTNAEIMNNSLYTEMSARIAQL